MVARSTEVKAKENITTQMKGKIEIRIRRKIIGKKANKNQSERKKDLKCSRKKKNSPIFPSILNMEREKTSGNVLK